MILVVYDSGRRIAGVSRHVDGATVAQPYRDSPVRPVRRLSGDSDEIVSGEGAELKDHAHHQADLPRLFTLIHPP